MTVSTHMHQQVIATHLISTRLPLVVLAKWGHCNPDLAQAEASYVRLTNYHETPRLYHAPR